MAVHSKIDDRDHTVERGPFEFCFYSDSPDSPALCAADEIFLAGKILPFGAPPPKRYQISEGELRRRDLLQVDHRTTRCTADDVCFWGGAQSKAGYRRLRKVSDCDGKELEKATAARTQKEPHRPRWFLFVLGSMRVPETMDMGNIRNRQRRRRSRDSEPGGDVGRGTWRLLRSLSCRRFRAPPL
ncbi:hypothetical protein ZIOFF_071852 [Zingiber officinale]|uniref:Uncharacterized protein n=1 Tax=Zingiber officinale TaxID=94328 RepID=A0A8J5CA57_ZINOF|nr:hypothetical protein ZIOFF_071852 [Zingiber officinale]